MHRDRAGKPLPAGKKNAYMQFGHGDRRQRCLPQAQSFEPEEFISPTLESLKNDSSNRYWETSAV